VSKIVVLGLLGIGAVAGGSLAYDWFAGDEPEQATQRNGYTTREDCERNYSREQCSTDSTYRPGIGFVPIFWGPFYQSGPSFVRRSGDPGPGRVSRGTFVEQGAAGVSRRGGFGSTAPTYSGSGG